MGFLGLQIHERFPRFGGERVLEIATFTSQAMRASPQTRCFYLGVGELETKICLHKLVLSL